MVSTECGSNWMKKFQRQPESQRNFLKSIISKLTTMYIVLLRINSIIIIHVHVQVVSYPYFSVEADNNFACQRNDSCTLEL